MGKAVPHVQPIVLAVSLPHEQRVVLQVKGLKGERDLGLRRGDDDVRALQVVRVLVRKAWRFNHAG